MKAIKDLYSIYLNHYGIEDSKEVSTARDKLEECLGENYTREIEEIAGDLEYFSSKHLLRDFDMPPLFLQTERRWRYE